MRRRGGKPLVQVTSVPPSGRDLEGRDLRAGELFERRDYDGLNLAHRRVSWLRKCGHARAR
jgi:hypothetical protein